MPKTLLRVLRATFILVIVAIGMAMNTAHKRAQANTEQVTEMCRRYLERRASSTVDEEHPQIRRLDRSCGLRRDF